MIFPEGDVYRDGTTHPFKAGTAKIALTCNASGIDMPIIPMAIRYIESGPRTAKIVVGAPINVKDYLEEFAKTPNSALKSLTARLRREVCHLKLSLGQMSDSRRRLHRQTKSRMDATFQRSCSLQCSRTQPADCLIWHVPGECYLFSSVKPVMMSISASPLSQ